MFPRNVVVDMRCLQDPNYATRGVGRHALALLRAAPGDVRLVGLTDPSLPPLIDEARDYVTETHPNAYAAIRALDDPDERTPFVSLSPMTHDPLFAARFLSGATRLRVAVVYDFIPLRWPERYLPDPTARLAYANALRWLARCDLFAPISVSAGDDLMSTLRAPAAAIAVTGAPLDPHFEAPVTRGGARRRHLLVVGGADPRKNPDLVVRAHAGSRALQEAGIRLVVGGQYPPAEAERLKSIASEAGGRPDLVAVPGAVSEEALVALYAQAMAIVCPSFDEGFSLPVVEGMAAGVPVFASDIPAHRELVRDPALRFPPDDADALAPLLERVARDPAWADSVVAGQAGIWPRFRAKEVGRRFWEAVEAGLAGRPYSPPTARPQSPAVARGALPRVALLSPLPPDRSGVADYTAATCVELGRMVDLHVFSETRRLEPLAGATLHPFSALPAAAAGFDRVIHVVGNSHFHHRTFDTLLRFGGAAIAHDARMLGFYRILLGLPRALAAASAELERPVPESELNEWMADEDRLKALFLDEIMDAASPMIVHSAVTAGRLQARRGRSPVLIPFSVYRPWSGTDLAPEARAAARARLGLAPGDIAIVTLGLVDASKAPDECLWALDLLRGWGVPARLSFVGQPTTPEIGEHVQRLAAKLGLSDHVTFASDYVSEAGYRDAIAGADVAIQLRTYNLGGLSGALLDCASAGTPTVANRGLADAIGVPDAYVTSIPDALSPVLLAEAIADLLEAQRGRSAAAMREAARVAFCEERSMSTYAATLCRSLGLEVETRPARVARRVA